MRLEELGDLVTRWGITYNGRDGLSRSFWWGLTRLVLGLGCVAIVTFRVSGDIPSVSMTVSEMPRTTSGAGIALGVFLVGFFLLVGLFSDLEPFEGVRVLAALSLIFRKSDLGITLFA